MYPAFDTDPVQFRIRKNDADPSRSGSGSTTLVLEKSKILELKIITQIEITGKVKICTQVSGGG
jgi:hypothetical protein